ncbi:hypothetical protein LIA77_02988 [Sarocladium implicatum]|nr:hypothetical protein LIA77_02988 [Sarocladium implicatum]
MPPPEIQSSQAKSMAPVGVNQPFSERSFSTLSYDYNNDRIVDCISTCRHSLSLKNVSHPVSDLVNPNSSKFLSSSKLGLYLQRKSCKFTGCTIRCFRVMPSGATPAPGANRTSRSCRHRATMQRKAHDSLLVRLRKVFGYGWIRLFLKGSLSV